MFCSEPIISVYRGSRDYDDIDGANSFLDYYNELAYHVTVGCRMVFETEHYFISLSANGVTLSDKDSSIEELQEHGEYLENHYHIDDMDEDDIPWIDYEHTLFVGESLLK